MLPVIFQIGPLSVYSFGLMLVLGFLSAWRLLEIALDLAGEKKQLAESLVFWAALGGILGAKILYFINNVSAFMADPFGAIFSGAGFVFYGGLLGGATAVYLLLRKEDLTFLRIADLSSPVLALGYGVGRIGCHLSGDGDYGIPTDLPWGVSYALGVIPTPVGVLVHPTPVYEALVSLTIAAYLMSFLQKALKRKAPDGQVFGLYLLLTASARFLVEFLRIEPKLWMSFSEAQIVSLLLLPLGLYLLKVSKNVNNEKNA